MARYVTRGDSPHGQRVLLLPWYAVVRSGWPRAMGLHQPIDVSIRQFVADAGSVTRGLRQGRTYTLTLNGVPLARMIPIRRRRAVPKEEVLAIFATAPVVDADELRTLMRLSARTSVTRTRALACDRP